MTCSNDTHIRSCGIMQLCIDSRVRERWDMEYYVKHHMVGGFFNDALDTGKSFNAQYVTTEMRCENLRVPLQTSHLFIGPLYGTTL